MTNDPKTSGSKFSEEEKNVPTVLSPLKSRRRRSRRSRLSKLIRRFRRSVRWQGVLVGSCVLVLVAVLSVSVLITDASSRLDTAWQGMSRVLDSITVNSGAQLTLNDFNRLKLSLTELLSRLETTNSRVRLLGPIVALNPDWQGSVQALSVAQDLNKAAVDMLSGLQPTIDFVVQGEEDDVVATRISSGERIVELLQLGRGLFSESQKRLDLAEAKLKAIDLTNLSPNLLLQIEQLQAYQSQLVGINQVLSNGSDVLTNMLGLDSQKTYLVLAQNNDELRPSGGYISTFGWFTINGGRVIDFNYSPTTDRNPNPPDESFATTFEVPHWWIQYGRPVYAAWDGSWHADFPETAKLAMNFYNAGGNPKSPVDGVLGIDITSFEYLLEAIGDVPMPDYNVVVNASNFRQLVYDIRAFGEDELAHKTFIADVYKAIFEKWRTVDQDHMTDVLNALIKSIQRRHLMIYFADEETNNVIAQLGWNGLQQAGLDHDYIMVVDANLGNKSNHSIIRSMTYDVAIQPEGTLHGRLTLRYEYFADTASLDPAIDPEYHGPIDYRNLMQIFVPKETIFTNDGGFDAQVVADDTHTLLVGRVEILYDTSVRYQLEYQTPVLVDNVGTYKRYRLLVQKQSGARTQNLNIQISLPPDARVISSVPAATASYNLEQPILDYRLQLEGDQWIEVIYQD